MHQQPRREPEIDLEQILNKVRAALSRFGGRGGGSDRTISLITLGLVGLALILWLATGFFTVSPGEKGVLRTFGKCCKTEDEGLKWWWPAPIGTRNVESVTRIRSMELGFSSDGGVSPVTILEEGQMIAGDLNIVDVPLVVQYQVRNPEKFLFNVSDPGEQIGQIPPGTRNILPGRPEGRTLKDATEAALRLVVGQRSIDDVLLGNRTEVQQETQVLLQNILDSYDSGIFITEVRLQDVKAPEQVRDAFDDVRRARQDREASIEVAKAYEQNIIPNARGDAEQIIRDAEAYREQRIAEATGKAKQFEAILAEYTKSKDVTRQRLYLEAIEEVLSNITKIVVSPDAEGGIILNTGGQIVPVPGLSGSGTSSGAQDSGS